MAEIVQDPQLRYTSDTQIPVAEMLVQFDAPREGDPPATLKVIAWRKLAEALAQNYRRGDRVILEGRLSMILVDRSEGFKEKRAEMTAQRIHTIASSRSEATQSLAAAPSSQPVAAATPVSPSPVSTTSVPSPQIPTVPSATPTPVNSPNEPLVDDIPF